MAARGGHDRAAGGGSFHAVRPEFTVRDASDEQLRSDSTSEDVASLDFDHVNPVSGPVYVRGARHGDVLAVEILEFRPREWGWTRGGRRPNWVVGAFLPDDIITGGNA